MSEKKLDTMQEIADFFHVTRMTIIRWDRKVQIPRYSGDWGSSFYIKGMTEIEAREWRLEVRRKMIYNRPI